MPRKIERSASLLDDRQGAISPVYPFTFTVNVTCYQFNTTNFDVCEACIIKAVNRVFNA